MALITKKQIRAIRWELSNLIIKRKPIFDTPVFRVSCYLLIPRPSRDVSVTSDADQQICFDSQLLEKIKRWQVQGKAEEK